MAVRVKSRVTAGPALDQIEYDVFWTEYQSIKDSGQSSQPEDESEDKEPAGEGDQELQWLKEAGFNEIVKKYRDSKEIDPEDVAGQNITSSLTRKQAEAVKRRIDTLNEFTKKRLSGSESPPLPLNVVHTTSKHSNYTDVRTIFPVQTAGQPSNATAGSSTSSSHSSSSGSPTSPTSPTWGPPRKASREYRRPSLPRRAVSEGVNLIKPQPFRDDSGIEKAIHGQYTSLADIHLNGESHPHDANKHGHARVDRRESDDVRLHSGVQQTKTQHGSVFYVTGLSKQELFNAAQKTKESSVDDLEDSRLKFKDANLAPPSLPDVEVEQPESFHEAAVDVPNESLSPKLNGRNNGLKGYSAPQFPRLPNYTLTKDELGVTHISDISKDDMEKVRSLALIELTALFDQHGIALHRRKPAKKKFKECGVFEVPLQHLVQHDQLRGSSSNVPLFLQELIRFLDQNGLREEGILRVGGATARVKAIKEEIEECFSEGTSTFSWEGRRVHDMASLLKQFLRELPSPLLTYEYQPTFASVERIPDRRQQLQALNLLILLLPPIHRDCLRVLLTFMSRIISHEKQNKMNLNNVSMIMAPNLFHFSSAKTTPSIQEVKQAQATVNIVRMLIKYKNILWTIPGFMVMQVRYLYEAEGNRKIKDTKAVRKLLLKKSREGGGSPQKKHSSTEAPIDLLEADLANNIIRVKAPMLNKIAMAIQLTFGMKAGDIVAKFRRRPEGADGEPIQRRHKLREVMSPEYRDCVNPHDNNKFAHDRHHLYEVGGNIGVRCLDNETNMMALYKVNPHAEWIIKPRTDYE